MATTKKPTGLTASRRGDTFVFEWKIADDNYDAGIRVWLSNRKKVLVNGPISGKSTSYAYRYNLNNPTPGLTFSVKGQRRKDKGVSYAMSPTATRKFDFVLPLTPSVAYFRDTSVQNSGYFSWSTNADDSWWSIYTGYEWESKLFKNHNSSTPPTNWSGATKGSGSAKSSSRTFTEDSGLFHDPNYSYTRWFRVRSVGPKGKSAWRYARHTYAQPLTPRIDPNSISLQKKSGINGYMCNLKWAAEWNFQHPIESVDVEYAITTPITSSTGSANAKKMDWSCPDNPGWTHAGTIKGSDSTSAFSFSIDRNLGSDEVLFLHVLSNHDDYAMPSKEHAVTNIKGYLPDPVDVSIGTPDPGTHRVTVSATNDSGLADSYIAVYYRTASMDQPIVVGILPKGTPSMAVQCPNWGTEDISIGLRTIFASYSSVQEDGYTRYEIDESESIAMQSSSIIWDDSRVPKAPNIELSAPNSSTVRVIWDWPWEAANQTELSWADHDDAWESTNQPSSYIVTNEHAGQWNIAGLGVGTWYVRARLISAVGDTATYGMWSEIKEIKLSSAPAIPSLTLSEGIIGPDEEVTCYWAYVTTDGTAQMQADICEAILDEETQTFTYESPFAKTETAQHITISAKEHGWLAGEKHYLAVRVISASGEQSQGWSTPVALEIAAPINATIVSTSLETRDKELDAGDNPESISELVLTRLPLTVEVDGTGDAGKTIITIERSGYYLMDRPDESENDGFDKEAVFLTTYDGDGTFTLNQDDFIGYLDDGAPYRLVVTVKDTHGQTAESDPIEFKVRWDHQAVVPSGSVQIDHEYGVAILSPEVPAGTTVDEGDVCDIYRLSVDKPQLIYSGAIFGEKYVDPYPTIGEHGGYRFVYRTFNGDYTTEDGTIAWYDTTEDDSNDIFDTFGVMINYGNDRLVLPYNVTLNSKWSKDFQTTNYLGGHIQGDWNPAVSRTGSISTVGIVYDEYASDEDMATIEAVRRLATYPGVCHVRTPDGSTYAANINVTEDRENKMINQLANYSLEITRVDSESLDGLSYNEWLEEIGEE